MFKKMNKVLLTGLTPFLLMSTNVFSEEAAETDMNSYLCKDIMRMSEDHRNVILGLLHGYQLRAAKKQSFNSTELSKVSTDFIEHCLDNPHDKAFESFKKISH